MARATGWGRFKSVSETAVSSNTTVRPLISFSSPTSTNPISCLAETAVVTPSCINTRSFSRSRFACATLRRDPLACGGATKSAGVWPGSVVVPCSISWAITPSPAVTLLKVSTLRTFSSPKWRRSISSNTGICDEPPVRITTSICSGRSPDAATVSCKWRSMASMWRLMIRSNSLRVIKSCTLKSEPSSRISAPRFSDSCRLACSTTSYILRP